MSDTNLVSFAMSAEDETAVNDALQVINEKLMPYVVSLTPEERMERPKK